MKNYATLAHWASKCASICTFNKNRYYLFFINLLLTLGVANAWGAEPTATLTFDDNAKRTTFTTSQQVWEENGVTFTNDKASSTNSVADYAKPARLYAGSSVTVACSLGNMTQIVFDCNSSSYATAMKNSIGTVSGATVSVSSDKVTVTFTSAVESFTIAKLTAQVRLDAITVTYEEGSSTVSVTSVTLNKTELDLIVEAHEQLTATVLPNDATNKNVSWSSDNTAVATVSDNGLVTAVGEGKATITVTTEDGNKTATCTISVTAPAGGDDDGDCEYVWKLVTDDTTLQPLDKVIITASGDSEYALSTNQKSSNRVATAVTKNGDLLEDPSADVQILTLVEVPGSTGVFAFLAEGVGYLYAASSTGNQLKTKTALDDNGKWTIKISEGIASIVATVSSNRNVMQYNYNSGSPLFSCYASATQTSLAIYKKTCITETAPSLTASESSLSFGEVTVNSSKELTFNLSGSDLTANATLALTGTNANMFSINPTTVTQSSGSINQTITVTYTPTAKGEHTATLTISSTDAENVSVSLSGTGKAQMANYTVKHYQENLNGTYPTTPTDTETLSGEVGTQVTPAVKSYTGFKAPSAQTVTIKSDGSTVVTYEYTRNSYTLTWDVNGGNALTGSYTSGSVKYGAAITKPEDPTREGHVFKGWHNGTSIVTPATTMPASNLTYTAQWTPTYTITWLANGQEFHKQENEEEGTALDLPDSEPDAATYACDDKVFVGWTANPISGSTNDEPDDLFTTKTAYVEDAATTYYAVFATADGSSGSAGGETETTLDFSAQGYENGEVVESLTIGDVTIDLNKGTNSNDTKYYSTGTAVRVYGGGYFTVSIPSGNITKIVITTGSGDGTNAISADSDTYDTTNKTWTGSASSVKFSIAGSTGHRRIKSVDVTYTTGGGTSYSDYVTTCAVIPDPVWGGAVIDNATIAVNCGETSPMNSAATISFPAATNNTLTYDITVTASNGFLVSTNKTDNTKYGESVTVSPVKTGTNAGTITSNVYVRAVAPAMSSDDFTGTITISGKQIETQTINVTADVTCTGYTLTLVDRGVSTEQPGTYFAGQTIDEAPADPTGVCTDPIHYVFDGWAEETVDNGSTEYTKVTFPYEVTGNTKFYAVYRYTGDGGEPSNDFVKVTSAKDDWTGDYVIVNEDVEKAIGNAYKENTSSNKTLAAVAVTVTDNKVVSPSEDIIWQIRKNGENYTMYNAAAGKYAYVTTNDARKAGLSDDPQDMNISWGSDATKTRVYSPTYERCFSYYSSNSEWRTYAISTYSTGTLYCRSLETYLYTTSPVCGPYVEITSDKDIYVTGGNARGTHDLVVAQQKVAYQATRLKKDNETGNLPSIQVRPANITYDATKTKNVTITFDEDSVRTLQSDDTYTISGTMTISYRPETNNVTDDIQVVLNANYNPSADVSNASFTIHARSLPQEFVIVAKQGDKWYALNGDMSNGSSANPANGHVVVDDDNEPTKATYAPCNTIYTFDGLPNTGDRTYVRFQGTDGAWLWAASGTNVGIQNKSLKNTPSGNMEESKPYNWEIETENNITYFFHNANSSRVLRLNDGKFGMYAGGTDVIRILPYEAKCLYNYAPSNLKVSELKSTYVTLVWDAVAGATKYQYSTDATNWTDAGSEPTVTISGLSSGTNYTYYIRAYHADAGVSQECFDYSEVTFTTADCDDVPTDITYTADLNSITVSWTAAAPTATIKLFMDADGTGGGGTYNGATSPYKISGGLTKNTTYYIQILADGTCASPIIPVKTEDVKVDIVEWLTDGIIVDINTNETVGVTLENEVSYGSGSGAEATELFFSKYYEASYNVKLVAIYNGTKNLIDLTDYEIHYGKDSWESQYVTLKDFGATKGKIQPGEEIILYTMQDDSEDDDIMDCVNDDYPDGKWVRVTSSNNTGKGTLAFAGNKTLVLKKAGTIIDVIGALDSSGKPTSTKANAKPSWGDANGWNCATGLSIADDTQIGISTNRCLLIRNNDVTSGATAVTSNIDDFVTLCSEWKGAHVPKTDDDNGVAASCENFAYVGTFDYSDYYTKYESMGEEIVFEENVRNGDGTVTIPITDLYKQSCRNIRITLEDKDGNVLTDQEYKVPIMITTTQGTDGQTFLELQQNLATIETDGEGNVVATHPLSLDEVREICKTCDVVIRDNATLQKMADDAENDHPQVRDIYVYENSSLVVPNGTNYTINNLSLRRKGDNVASLNVYPGALKLPESAAAPISLDLRVDAQNWHWFTLPYNCNIADVTWVDGSPAQYNVDWFLMTYDGESRSKEQSHYENHWKQYFGTTIEAGKGYIVGITGDINNPAFTYELRFPIAKEVLADETTDKTVDVRAWGVEDDIRPNQKGWNLIGNPYLAYYQKDNVNSFGGLRLGELIGPDPQTGLWEQTGNLPYVVVPVEGGWVSYEQLLVSETDLLPFTAYFVQVGNDGTHTSEQELSISFDHTKLQLSATPMPASIIQRSASEIDQVEEPVIVGVSLTNAQGESDKTSLVIDNQFTDEYEMNADFFKWFGDYYKYYTKPVLYTIGADQGKRAFNALSEELASQPISLGMFAAKAGNYTFSLDLRSDLSKVQEVWLYDATQDTYTNLLQDSYTFYTAKTESAGRFFLSVKMAPKVSTDIDNVTDGTIWATTQDHTIFVNGLLSDAQLWIYDATGKLLHTDQTQYYQHSYSIPISGTYFVRVQNTMQTQTIKVVVE